MEIHRHFIDKNGNRYVAPFDDEAKAKSYKVPDDVIEVQPENAPRLVITETAPKALTPVEKLERAGLTLADFKVLMAEASAI